MRLKMGRERLERATLATQCSVRYFTNCKSQFLFFLFFFFVFFFCFTQAWMLCFTHSLSYKTHSWQYWNCVLLLGYVVPKTQTRLFLHGTYQTFRKQWQQHQSLVYKQHAHNCFSFMGSMALVSNKLNLFKPILKWVQGHYEWLTAV